MKSDWIHKYQMLDRVYNFGQTYLSAFPKGSAASEVLAAIGLAVANLKNHASQQVSGAGAMQKSGNSHMEARKSLKSKLDLISQTAKVLNLDQFYMPRPKNDAAYIAAGQSFAELAQPQESKFIKQGLPIDFIAALGAAVIELQRTLQAQSSSKGAHSGSIASFNETLKQATVELKRLDALVKNSLGNDPAIMAAWRIARRVSHSGTTTKVAAAEPPPVAAGAAAGKSV